MLRVGKTSLAHWFLWSQDGFPLHAGVLSGYLQAENWTVDWGYLQSPICLEDSAYWLPDYSFVILEEQNAAA